MSHVQYGSWNPRGTSNSEYGRFIYQNNFIGAAPSGRNFNGESWVPNLSNYHQEHLPGCHNYVQGQGQQGQYQQHQPGCHNYQPQAQGQGQGQGHGQTQGQEDRPFDVFVGEEAATTALGGKEQFQTHFPDYVNNIQQQPQSGGEPGAGPAGMDGAPNEICGQMSQMSLKSISVKPSNTQIPNMSPTPVPQSNQNAAEEGCEPVGARPQPSATQVPVAAECPPSTGGGDGGQMAPTMENSCKIPQKWRGLPPNIQYGRHIRPLHARYMRQQQQQPNCLTDAQLQEELGLMGPGPSEDPGCGDNSVQTPTPKSKPVKRVPVPATPKYLNKVTSSATAMSGVGKSLKTGSQSCSRVPATTLCGKCPKCKDYFPPVSGPPVMSFPKSSTATIPKPNLHNMHITGQRDAKNFRAPRYRNSNKL